MTKTYHFWITGCQMNYADARRVATELEKLGYRSTPRAEDADVVVLETCTVRHANGIMRTTAPANRPVHRQE